jgi:predicted  nucleic acid-binding Zn-ribbon protein
MDNQELIVAIKQLESRLRDAEKRIADAEKRAEEAVTLVEQSSKLLVEHIATLDERLGETADIFLSNLSKKAAQLKLSA